MSVKNFLRSGDHEFNNVLKSVYNRGIFDCDWFDAVRAGKQAEKYFEDFIEDFTNYIRNHDDGVAMLDTPNNDIDVEYYMSDYIDDERHDDYDSLVEYVHDWVQADDDYLNSDDYFTSMYAFSSGATDNEFYANNIEKFARDYWKDNDDHHGFETVDDLITAMKEVAYYNGDIEDLDCYDAGGYGTMPSSDDYNGYIVCGCFWGGNGEEEFQMETSVPFDEDHDYNNVVYRDFCINGDCIYSPVQFMCVYGISWDKLEEYREENM